MAGIEKSLKKLERALTDGNDYEASQMYHSISQRLVKQKKDDEAIVLVVSGVKVMLEHQQHQSALDLVERLFVLKADRLVLADLIRFFPVESEWCDIFVKKLIQ